MTVLVADLGNSRFKIATVDSESLGDVVSGAYDEGTGVIDLLLPSIEPGTTLMVASVARPRDRDVILDRLAREAGVAVKMISAAQPLGGIVPGYRRPEQLGVDRLLAMIAVKALTDRPFCVVDAGTAVTMDFVDEFGQHMGGLILPGQQMFRDCLVNNTSIPRDRVVHPSDVLGRDTPTGVARAAAYAVAGIAEMFLEGRRALFAGREPELFVGGGNAEDVVSMCAIQSRTVDHLVLRGLAVLALNGDV